MAAQPTQKRDPFTDSGMTPRRSSRIQKLSPFSGFLSRSLAFLFLEGTHYKVKYTNVILGKKEKRLIKSRVEVIKKLLLNLTRFTHKLYKT